jgi:hypothetical protein
VTDLREDDRLRERFQRLRAETEEPGRVPDFQAMLARARREAAPRLSLEGTDGDRRRDVSWSARRRLVRAGMWASAALAATVAGVLLTRGRTGGEEDFERLVAAYQGDAASGAWKSPTSGLLDVPGIGVVRSLPSIGGPAVGLDPDREPATPPRSKERS